MPATHAMAREAKARRPKKKISMANTDMSLVYDAENLKHHGSASS
jgi:hypothetical protein